MFTKSETIIWLSPEKMHDCVYLDNVDWILTLFITLRLKKWIYSKMKKKSKEQKKDSDNLY